MKLKTLFILCLIFILLFGLVLVKKVNKVEPPISEALIDIVKADLSKEKVSDVFIEFKGKEIQLSNKLNNGWSVASEFNARAQEDKVETFLDSLDGLKGELRSSDSDLLNDYGIQEGEGINIKVSRGVKLLTHIVLGTKKAGWNKNFVRNKYSNDVYMVEENVLSNLGFWDEVQEESFREDGWIDKKIVHVALDRIKEINLEQEGELVTQLVKVKEGDQDMWQFKKEYSQKIDQDKVNEFLRKLTGFKADFIAELDDAHYPDVQWKMTISYDDKQVDIIRGKKEDNKYFVKVSDKAYAFKIFESSLEKLSKKDEDFFKKEENPQENKEAEN